MIGAHESEIHPASVLIATSAQSPLGASSFEQAPPISASVRRYKRESISQESVSSAQASKAYQGAKLVHTFVPPANNCTCEIISHMPHIMDQLTPPAIDAASLDADAFRRLYPEQYFQRFLDDDIRPDGRTLGRSRATNIGIGTITSVDGSALVKQGNTTVVSERELGSGGRTQYWFHADAMRRSRLGGVSFFVSAHSGTGACTMHQSWSKGGCCRHASTIQFTLPHLCSLPACVPRSPVHPSRRRAAAPSP